MSELSKPDPKALSDEAIEWLVLLRSGTVSVAERRRFAEWRARSPEHARAFEDAERLFGLMCEAAAEEWPAERMQSRRSVLAVLRRPRFAVGLMAAILVATALHFLHLSDPWLSDYHAGTGEQRPIALADGSRLLLNTDTAVSLFFTSAARRVRLEHGQALFTVVPDPKRPFEVEVGKVVVQALGTVFEIYEHKGEVAVTVLEHAVEIGLAANLPKTPAAKSPHPRLVAGERLRYRPDTGFGATQAVDLRAASAWQRRKLIVKDQALEGVLAELDRYRPGMIRIFDPVLKERRITTLLRGVPSPGVSGTLTPAEGLERLLAGTGMRYRFVDAGTVTIERAPKTSPPPEPLAQATPPPKPKPTVLPEMTVTAKPTDPTSYNAPNATTATKTDTPILETPASIHIVTAQSLRDRQVSHLADLDFTYQFNDAWKLNWVGLYAYQETAGTSTVGISNLDEATGQVTLGAQVAETGNGRDQWFTMLNLTGELSILGTKHRLLAGFDYNRDDDDDFGFFFRSGIPVDFNIFDPIHDQGVRLSLSEIRESGDAFSLELFSERWGIYVQDQIKITDQLHVVLGGRFDDVVQLFTLRVPAMNPQLKRI